MKNDEFVAEQEASQRWRDADGVVHAWFIHGGYLTLPRVTRCMLVLLSWGEDRLTYAGYERRTVFKDALLFEKRPLTCLVCMAGDADAVFQ